jgi:hypothetical protein
MEVAVALPKAEANETGSLTEELDHTRVRKDSGKFNTSDFCPKELFSYLPTNASPNHGHESKVTTKIKRHAMWVRMKFRSCRTENGFVARRTTGSIAPLSILSILFYDQQVNGDT